MSIVDSQFRTITCNTCGKTVTFEPKDTVTVNDANSWLKTLRVIQTFQGRNYCYCSDECELAGVAAGNHNPVEVKKIIAPSGNLVAQAAAAAKAAEETTKALKEGAGVVLQQG